MREFCPICHELLDYTSVSGRCNHNFHFGCLDRWLQLNSSCPYCRDEINHLITVFHLLQDLIGFLWVIMSMINSI